MPYGISKENTKNIKAGIYTAPIALEMYTEIFEEENSLNNLEKFTSINGANFYNFPIKPQSINKIVLVGCGTAYHSCLVAKYWFETFTSLNVETDIASEFRYRNVRFNKNNLYLFVSQSGETADTAAAATKIVFVLSLFIAFCPYF